MNAGTPDAHLAKLSGAIILPGLEPGFAGAVIIQIPCTLAQGGDGGQ